MKNNKDIDDLFKRVLEDPVDQPIYREDDWDAMEQLLDKGKKRSAIIYWLPLLAGVAALLLIVFGWWMFKPQGADEQQSPLKLAAQHKPATQQQVAVNKAPETGNTTKPALQPAITDKPEKGLTVPSAANKVGPTYLANNLGTGKKNIKSGATFNEPLNPTGKSNAPVGQTSIEQEGINIRDNITWAEAGKRADITPATGSMPAIASVNILPKASGNGVSGEPASLGKPIIKKTGFTLPKLTLSVLASSDLNGINSFKQSTAGHNYGLLLSVEVLKKFTITSGVNYSIKPYSVPFENYHTAYKFKYAPQTVAADCRMLDIPLNIDYQLYNKHRNKISVGTGFSSYLMRHESYTYNYDDPSVVRGPSYYDVKAPGKYLFSILNLQATYQRQLNSKVGISVQPYFKLPLSNIGYSQIKLQSTGVAVGLNWNINSLTKPK